MEGPAWWNNRLWRSATVREDRPSSTASLRMVNGQGMGGYPGGASNSSHLSHTLPSRQREKKLIRPNFRPSTPKRDGRPLAAMRISFFNGGAGTSSGTGHGEEFSYTAPIMRSGTPSVGFNNRNNPGSSVTLGNTNPALSSSVVYGRSLTPSPMNSYTVYNRPSSVALHHSKPQTSTSSSSSLYQHSDMYGDVMVFGSMQSLPSSRTNSEPPPQPASTSSSGPPQNQHYNSMPTMSTASNENFTDDYNNNSSVIQSRQTVVASRFGRRVLRPNLSQPQLESETKVGDSSSSNTNSSAQQQQQQQQQQLQPGTETSTEKAKPSIDQQGQKTGATSPGRPPVASVNNHAGDGDGSSQQDPSPSVHRPMQAAPAAAAVVGTPSTSAKPPLPPNPSNTPTVITSTASSPGSLIRGNLWPGSPHAGMKELILTVPTEGRVVDMKPPVIQETYPLRSPLKSILKKSNSSFFSNGLSYQQADPFQAGNSVQNRGSSLGVEGHHLHKVDVLNSGSPQSQLKFSTAAGSTNTTDPQIASTAHSNGGNHFNGASFTTSAYGGRSQAGDLEERTLTNHVQHQQQSALLRRSLQSAPSLKRAVRFNMGQNAVLEFHPTENHYHYDDSDYI